MKKSEIIDALLKLNEEEQAAKVEMVAVEIGHEWA